MGLTSTARFTRRCWRPETDKHFLPRWTSVLGDGWKERVDLTRACGTGNVDKRNQVCDEYLRRLNLSVWMDNTDAGDVFGGFSGWKGEADQCGISQGDLAS